MGIPPKPPLLILTLFLFLFSSTSSTEVEVESDGTLHTTTSTKPKLVKATFINSLPSTQVNLYWTGSNTFNSSPKIFYGPIEPNGGKRVLEGGYEGSVFVLTKSGGFSERLGEFVLTSEEKENVFELTEEMADGNLKKFPPKAAEEEESKQREKLATLCRRTVNTKGVGGAGGHLEKCQTCVGVQGCGYSPVRASQSNSQEGCFVAHSIATINDSSECSDLYNDVDNNGGIIHDAASKSVDAWLNLATELTLGNQVQMYRFNVYYGGVGPKSLRAAYRCCEMAVQRAHSDLIDIMKTDDKTKKSAATLLFKRAKSALYELESKLQAVFDDVDAVELLTKSRHDELEKIHPNMEMVPRRTVQEAREYIIRGEPVVINNLFQDGDANTSPVAHKWTLEYLNQRVFGTTAAATSEKEEKAIPKFNVAADITTRCCRYFEPQFKAQKAGYIYPFVPTTHMYRDTFDGFVKTVRKSNRNMYKINDNNEVTISDSKKRVLHYLHEIVMSDGGDDDPKAVVAGGPAPPQFSSDLQTILSQLKQPLASQQPFFGNFASAKVWLGQKNIIMPLHYDSTDNLYVMAWGRKRAILGEAGQLDALYRYPNEHPLAGSSQVNLTAPDLDKFPRFQKAKLREVIVGPGDVLYLPAWWWHQFEQPFEDTAALNVWSSDREQAPDVSMRDVRIREHVLADQLEQSVVDLFGVEAGVVLEALSAASSGSGDGKGTYVELEGKQKDEAMEALHNTANAWKQSASDLPGHHPKVSMSAVELVKEHLECSYKEVMVDVDWSDWVPGVKWDLSKMATLPRDLRERCEDAPESSQFMSICG